MNVDISLIRNIGTYSVSKIRDNQTFSINFIFVNLSSTISILSIRISDTKMNSLGGLSCTIFEPNVLIRVVDNLYNDPIQNRNLIGIYLLFGKNFRTIIYRTVKIPS